MSERDETQALLHHDDPPPIYQSVQAEPLDVPEECPALMNQFSTVDLCWILGGLWSAVFLGALDGRLYAPGIPRWLNIVFA